MAADLGRGKALKKTSGCMPQINCEELNLVSGELSGVALMPKKPSVLMHACCGPCSTSCVERTAADYALTLYYYNPNITDREEYYLRRDTLLHFLDATGIAVAHQRGRFADRAVLPALHRAFH